MNISKKIKAAITIFMAGIITAITPITPLGIAGKPMDANAAGASSIVQRADLAYELQWKALKTIKGWQGVYSYTFYQGETYNIPYAQPYYSSGYIYYDIDFETYISSTRDIDSKFYTQTSLGLADSTYYGMDCSSFVSYCWDLPYRQTTYTLPLYAKDLGDCTYENVDKIKIGDALNEYTTHVVLVTDINTSSGLYEITEMTTPQLRRRWLTTDQLVRLYSEYSILRRNNINEVKDFSIDWSKVNNSTTTTTTKATTTTTTTAKKTTTTTKATTTTTEKDITTTSSATTTTKKATTTTNTTSTQTTSASTTTTVATQESTQLPNQNKSETNQSDIQTLQKEIEQLKQENKALKDENDNLKSENNKLKDDNKNLQDKVNDLDRLSEELLGVIDQLTQLLDMQYPQ